MQDILAGCGMRHVLVEEARFCFGLRIQRNRRTGLLCADPPAAMSEKFDTLLWPRAEASVGSGYWVSRVNC